MSASIKQESLGRAWLLGIVLDDKRFQKALQSCADIVTMDLEDAVTPDNKVKARERVVELIGKERKFLGGRKVWVRINDLFSPWGLQDLDAIAGLDVDGIVYPRVRGAEEVWAVRRKLNERGSKAKLKLILETPQAFMNINDIMRVPGIDSLTHGSGDLTLETGISLDDRTSLGFTATQTVLAARAFGAHVTVGLHMEDWRNEDAVRAYIRHAKMQGFDGLNSFYLPHMALIKEILTPTAQEVEHARRVIAAYEVAQKQGVPALVLDGKAILIHEFEKAHKLVREFDEMAHG